MNKKLGRLLRPGAGVYFGLMAMFCVAALAVQQYILAGAEIAVTAVAFGAYLFWQNRRKAKLQAYLQTALAECEQSNGALPPFPGILVRLNDGAILYANDQFIRITGFSDRMSEKLLSDVVPGLSSDWLSAGKKECPFDVTLKGRRYRVYGTVIHADDTEQTRLGMLYFTDLTELYLVRDEYVRSRPVVSIILIDNYDELTKNLTEGATSALNARLNDVINQWAEI